MYGAISQILRKFSFGLNSNFMRQRIVVVVHFISLRPVGFVCRNRTKWFPPLLLPSSRRVRHLHGTICTVSWKKKRGPRSPFNEEIGDPLEVVATREVSRQGRNHMN
jgi:hypothetical protein